jgi:hypothetical protein
MLGERTPRQHHIATTLSTMGTTPHCLARHPAQPYGMKKNQALHSPKATPVSALLASADALVSEIEVLQNTPGGITAQDQQLLDAIERHAGEIAKGLKALKTKA